MTARELDLSFADYLADNIGEEQPSLNASTAHTLATRSPAHAHYYHPKLGKKALSEEADDADDAKAKALAHGSALHELLLTGDRIAHVECENFRTKAAQEERDALKAAGKIPMSTPQLEKLQAEALIVTGRLLYAGVDLSQFHLEKTWVWRGRDGILKRARPDAYRVDGDTCYLLDLKTTRDAMADHAARAFVEYGYDVAACHYTEGALAFLDVQRVVTLYAFVESAMPHVAAVHEPSESMLEHGQKRYDRACKLWVSCLESGKWPGPSGGMLTPPTYALMREGM